MLKLDDIKRELQGPKGLISLLRKSKMLHFPTSIEMIAQIHLEFESHFDLSDVDLSLNKLLKMEYEMFKQVQRDWLDDFWGCSEKLVLNNRNQFPTLNSVFHKFKQGGKNIDSSVMMVGMIVGQSMSQSGRTRAGYSLMEHISWLLEKKGLRKGVHFQREVPIGTVRLDFLFPNKQFFDANKEYSITCAAMTTMNDRYRLALQQLQENTFQRVLTAIGSSNFSKKLGPASLTKSKLDAVREKGAKVVMIGSATKFFKDDDPVMSYSEWFDEIAYLRGSWLL